ncbi:MAG: DUF4838 domain-containing protein [Armatimonadota bacterium]
MNYMCLSLLCITLLTGAITCAKSEELNSKDTPIYIIANPGNLGSITTAAETENNVNFWDDDMSDDNACTECFAAVELRSFILKCTDIQHEDIKLISPSELPSSGYIIILGSRESNPLVSSLDTKDSQKQAFETPESYRIKIVKQPERTICIIEGAGRIGVLYGAYDYLNKLGMRFFGLGEQGTVYPTTKSKLIDSLDVTESPAFLTRGFHAWEARGNKEFFLWMVRNRMNYWTAAEANLPFLKKLGMRLAMGSHDIQTNFLNPKSEYPYDYKKFKGDETRPKDPYNPSPEAVKDTNADGKLTYFEAHPEWFGLIDGKRSDLIRGGLGHNYCTSNPDATAELAKNYTQGLIDGVWKYADVINFWMEDGGKWCQCDKCKAIGTPTDRLLMLIYQVNKEVQKARESGRLKRSVHITSLAYTETITPPTKALPEDFDYENCSMTFYPIQRCYVHTMSDSSCTERNYGYASSYLGWAPHQGGLYKGALFIGEYYNVSNFKSMPAIYTRTMAADIPWYHRTGARHFQYMHTLTKNWGPWALNQYLMAQLTWNVNTDVSALLDDYYARYYPTTSKETRRYYENLEDTLCNITWLKTYIGLFLDSNKEPLPFEHLKYDSQSPVLNSGPSLVDTMKGLKDARRNLDQSLLICKDAIETARLLEDDKRLSYAESMVDFYYHMIRIGMAEKSQNQSLAKREFYMAEKSMNELSKYSRDFIETFICPDDGVGATQAVSRFKAYKVKYGAAEPVPQK